MSQSEDLSELLGAAPAAPDPMFRLETLARIAARSARRAAWMRALRLAFASLALGVVLAGSQAAGFPWQLAQPLALTVSTLTAAAMAAVLAIAGPSLVTAPLQSLRMRA